MDYIRFVVQAAMYVDKFFYLEKEIKTRYDDDLEIIKATRLEKYLTYIQNRRTNMLIYLEEGRCSFCNNLSDI